MGIAKSMSLEFQQPESICVVEYMGERLYFGAEQVIDAVKECGGGEDGRVWDESNMWEGWDDYVDSSDLYRWIKML